MPALPELTPDHPRPSFEEEVRYDVYFTAVYESDGEGITDGVSVYSVGEYCKQIAAREGSAQQDFAKATAVYGCYAKAYFTSIGQMQ